MGVTTSRLSPVPNSRIVSLLGQATRVSPRHDILQLVYNTPNVDVSVAFLRREFKFARFGTPKITFVNVLLPIKIPSHPCGLTESSAKIRRIYKLCKVLGKKIQKKCFHKACGSQNPCAKVKKARIARQFVPPLLDRKIYRYSPIL